MALLEDIFADLNRDADPHQAASALEALAEALDNHTGALVDQGNLERKQLERAALEAAAFRPPRRWRRLVGPILVAAGVFLGGYAMVARAAGAYNESASEMRDQASKLAAQRQAEKTQAAYDAQHNVYCLHVTVGQFLAGIPADPSCSTNPPPPAPVP